MDDHGRLGLPELLRDIREVLTAPKHRFPVIRERGAVWGSLLLLSLPTYIGLWWVGGIYFDRDPVPGYSLLLPAVLAVVLVLLKVYLIHVVARLFEGRGRYSRATGVFKGILAVYGYAALPTLIMLALGATVLFGFGAVLGFLMSEFRIATICVLIALSIAAFIWHLILVVLALRTVYAMRDLKIVASFVLGSVLMVAPAFSSMLVVAEGKTGIEFVRPILSERLLLLHGSHDSSGGQRRVKVEAIIDVLRYRYQSPRRFEIIAIHPSPAYFKKMGPRGERISIRSGSGFRFSPGEQIVARIVGLPGEQVELASGRLTINGATWNEPYVASENSSPASLPARRLGSAEYLVLPDDRTLVEAHIEEWLVPRERITGRVVTNRWPIGWLLFRPEAFLEPFPTGRQ